MQPLSRRAIPVHVAVAALAGLASLATAPAARSQQTTTATPGGLQEVIVTAQRREQNLQDVGIAVSAVSSSDLTSLDVVSATDITKSMPAVVLTQPNGPSSFSLAIRGVVQNDFADHQESPAAIYVDDVYVSQMVGLAFSVFDLDRVEVLRGPQGTLFGKNATGGLANYVTRKPSDQPGGYLETTFGERNLVRVEGAINGPLSSGVDGRFAFQTNHYDPLFHNQFGGASDAENGNDWALRAQLLFKLPDNSQLLMSARYARQDVHAGSWEEYTTLPISVGYDALAGPNDNPYGTCPRCNASGLTNSGPFVIRDNISGYTREKATGLSGRYTRDFSGTALTVIGDYSTWRKDYQEDSDASPITLFQFFNGSNVDQQSLEARLNGGDKKLNWTAGLYGLRINGDYYEGWEGPAFFTAQQFSSPTNPNTANYAAAYAFPLDGAWPIGTAPYWNDMVQAPPNAALAPPGSIPATRSPYSLLTKSFAGFAQVEYRFTDLVGLTAGGRVTSDKKDYAFTWIPYLYFTQDPTGRITTLTQTTSMVLHTYVNSRSDTLYSGKAQLDFHVAPGVLAYAGVNRGVKGGGFTAPLFPVFINDLTALTFKPETLTSYEVGLKSEFLDHKLRLNGAAYYYDYKDYQALIYTVSLEQLIVNADATHKGAEAELEWAPVEALRLGAGLSYVDAIVKNVDTRGTGVKGDYVPGNAPKWTANAMARYTLPVGTGQLALQVDGNYLSSFWFNLADSPAVRQGGFTLANARVNYTPSGGKFEIGASIENLANKHYGTMGFDNTSINGLAQVYPGMPRWVKAHVNYRF